MKDQISLFDYAPVKGSETTGEYDRDSFGCCHRYRECSDAKKCLRTDERANHCQCRRNLESGRIFYGKNAVDFDAKRYESIRQRIDRLSTEARAAFDRIVLDLQEYNRCAKRCVIRNEYISEMAETGLLEFTDMGPAFPWRCAYQSYLAPIFKASGTWRRIFGERGEELKASEKRKLLISWLNGEGTALRDILAEPYRFAVLPIQNSIFSEEYYQDVLINGYFTRINPRSPFAEDGILSGADYVKEETRRVKLSRGYSAEEKKERLAAICAGSMEKPLARIEAGRKALELFERRELE